MAVTTKAAGILRVVNINGGGRICDPYPYDISAHALMV